MQERKLTRRDFLGLFGVGTTVSTLAIGAGFAALAVSDDLYNPKPYIDGPLMVGNLKLSALVMEHNQSSWEKYRDFVEKIVSRFPIIIPEYLPFEYTGRNGNFLTEKAVALRGSENLLFDKIEEQARTDKQEVLAVDPAYNASFIGFRGVLMLSELIAIEEAGFGLAREIGKSLTESTRRGLLRKTKNVGLTAAAFLSGVILPWEVISFPSTARGVLGWVIEDNTREYLATGLLRKASREVPPGSEALLIYPKTHWERMKAVLTNGDQGGGLVEIPWLRDIPLAGSFFRYRHYKSDGLNWLEV